jgi:hypothetical protein
MPLLSQSLGCIETNAAAGTRNQDNLISLHNGGKITNSSNQFNRIRVFSLFLPLLSTKAALR